MDAKRLTIALSVVAAAGLALPPLMHRHEVEPAAASPTPVIAPADVTPVQAEPQKAPLRSAWTSAHVSKAASAQNNEDDDRSPTEPLASMQITSPFGSRMHPILHRIENHPGVDLAASLNDPVHAVYDGIVTSAGWRGGYGNAVEIYHAKLHESTLYGHMNALEVRAGQRVAEGQVIGLAGTTGLSTGVHLHFGVIKDGGWRDPIAFLDGLSDAPQSTMIATAPSAPKSYRPKSVAVATRRATRATRSGHQESEPTIAFASPKQSKLTAAPAAKPHVDTVELEQRYQAAATAASTWRNLYAQGAVSRNDRDAKVAEATALQSQLKAAKAG